MSLSCLFHSTPLYPLLSLPRLGHVPYRALATSTWLYPLFSLPCLGHVHVAVSTLVPTVPWPRTFSCQTPRLLPDGMPLASRYAPCQTPRPYDFPLLDVRSTDMSRRVKVPYLEHMTSPYLEGVAILDVSCHVLHSECMTSKIMPTLSVLNLSVSPAQYVPRLQFTTCPFAHAWLA